MFHKKQIAVYAVLLSLIPLVSGCPLPELEDAGSNSLKIHITVKNQTSETKTVALLPAFGDKKKSGEYQWATGSAVSNYVEDPISLESGGKQELTAGLGRSFDSDNYDQFKDDVMSFLLQIDGDEYAGWDAQYGNGGRTLVKQGYGYMVMGDGYGLPVWYPKDYPSGVVRINSSWQAGVTALFTVTITGSGAAFTLDELIIHDPLANEDE
jgi:hypothetical protein